MKVLITGGAGYIGSHVAYHFMDLGHDVEIIDNLSRGNKNLIPDNAKLHKNDIGSGQIITNIIKKVSPDVIIHLAAYVEVEESTKNPLKYYENNLSKSISFLKSCIDSGANKIIFSSTAAVYGNSKSKIIKETDEKKPDSPYGKSKLMLEQFLVDLNQQKLIKNVTFRYFNVAGADQKMRTGQIKEPASHLIKVACETALNKRDILYIYGNDYKTKDGTCIRDYIHVADLAELHLKAAEYLLKDGQSITLNCGYSKGYSVLDVVNKVKKISNNDFIVKVSDRRLGDSSEVVADSSLCRNVLNWEPKNNNLEKIIKDAFEWEKLISINDVKKF